jgi:O-antigen ligase
VKQLAWTMSLVLIFVIPLENSIMITNVGTLSRMVGMVVAAVWLLAVVIEGDLRRPGLFHGLVTSFVAWAALSLFWSVDPPETVDTVRTYIQLLVLVYLLWDLYATPTRIRAGLQAYVLGAYIAVGSMVFNMLIGRGGGFNRLTVKGFNADTAGLMLAIAMPIAWGLGMAQTREGRHGLLRWVNLTYMPLAFLGIALTGTRTALIATLPAVVFAVASLARLSTGKRLLIGVVAVAGVLAIVPLIPQTSVDRFLTTGTEISTGNLSGRGHIWKMGLQTYTQHPVLGVGAGAFKAAVGIGKVAHNTFISILVELGIAGIALFLGIVGVALIQALRHPPWGARFWVTLILIWALGASSLTWELRKLTWLVLTLTAASGAAQQEAKHSAKLLEDETGAS